MPNFGLQLRSSKFRHVYGAQTRREHCFENVKITRNTHDSNFCAVNPNFLAVVLESSGGGTFAVLDVNRPGRVDVNCPKICGHSGAVMDVKWNPFNDFVIASASEDCTVKLWTIPQQGLCGVLSEWSADLHGHSRKVAYLEWHPTADNILMSVGFDKKIMIWNVEQAEPVTSLASHPDTIYSVVWGREGSVLASTCKDKKIRVLDARSAAVAVEMPGHASPKTSKCVFVNDHSIFTTGFSRSSDRQYALWDVRQSVKPVFIQDVDCSSGTILPYFDPDTNMVYMAGKGDGMIRYVEVTDNPADVFFLSYYQSHLPQRGLGMMPKRGVDTKKNELTRFYKLHASKNLVEPIPMIAPRKAEGFQHDIYPPTTSSFASQTADEWTSGMNRGPILLNLEDGSIIDKPRTSMSAAVQSPIGSLSQQPEITTYKAVPKVTPTPTATPTSVLNHAPQSFTAPPPPTALRTSPDGLQSPTETTNEKAGYNDSVPSSIKNIQRLSMNFENRDSHQPPSTSHLSSAKSLVSLRSNPSPQHQPPSHSHSSQHHSSPPFPNDLRPARASSCTVLNGTLRNDPVSPHHPLEEAGEIEEDDDDENTSSDGDGSRAARFGGDQQQQTRTDYSSTTSLSKTTTATTTVTTATLSSGTQASYPALKLAPLRQPPPSLSEHVSHVKLTLGAPVSPIALSPPANAIHVRKVWTPPLSPISGAVTHQSSTACPSTDSELKKAYFRQLGEIKSLQDQLSLKDKRIRDLEAELATVMTGGAGPINTEESNC